MCRHVFATVACLLFVFLWLTAGNQDALSPWIAALAGAAPCALNQPACERPAPGTAGAASGTAVEAAVQRQAKPVTDGARVERHGG